MTTAIMRLVTNLCHLKAISNRT